MLRVSCVTHGSLHSLVRSDVKGLKKAAQLALPHLTESEIDSIIPSKCVSRLERLYLSR